jgi:hypothetical protein
MYLSGSGRQVSSISQAFSQASDDFWIGQALRAGKEEVDGVNFIQRKRKKKRKEKKLNQMDLD